MSATARCQRHLAVEPVRGADVDHINVGAGHQGAVAGKRLRNGEFPGGFGGQVAHVTDGGYGHTDAAEGLDMHGTDEAGANDTGA